ncbi:TAL effector repeat-containing protein [Xanthomonas campestris]|uniref:TAL effector repeat-containing protein n=1 Tax=Xanthomonas campestris TaxID=339 RepID=UPI001E628D3D|nr:TAL effector repeat-containing protein [Xanthomonas campestris]MCC5099067.1 TAL effector repeat-containing protein [Xanthomonas campestris]
MDPIRSRTPSPALPPQTGPQSDGIQPSADRLVFMPAGSPLDGLPARPTMSRTRLPSPPAPLPAFSAGSFSDLLRQFDPSLLDTSLFDSVSAFGAPHTEAAPGEGDEVQSGLRAADDPQPTVHVAVTAARPPRAKPARPPRAKPARRRRAAQTSDASPAAQVDLRTLGYSQQQQEKIESKARSTVAQHHEALVGHGFTHAHIVALSKHPAALGTVAVKYQAMIAALPEATHEDVVGVGKQWSGARALEALLTLAGELRGLPLQLDTGQLLKIAKRGGVTAVEAVHAWRNALTGAPLNLTPEQVVAIASNNGGKQALETVQRLLPVLCQAPHDLTPEQVVAIASNGGGKQALETVQRLLPVLCQAPHCLTREQVVAIASNIGGKQALETVQALLPVLCQAPHCLTREQVVAIASHDGGKQALESIFAQLSRPDPALAALTNDRLVALACIGGRSALNAVKDGLPNALTLIRRANSRIPERTSHLVADHTQVVRVLGFFQCHSHPAQAFDEAMTQFGMSRHGLLQLFRRVGVTELEARSGTLPPASQRWHRMLQASGIKRAKPSSASAQTPDQESLHAFADSLERELDAPSPMDQAGQALASSRRKRSRSDRSVTGSSAQQAVEVLVPEQRDALHLPLLSWGVKRPRTRIGGLLDPGTPMDADLVASSTVVWEQDADPFAGTADDFPAFNEEELALLMELLPH